MKSIIIIVSAACLVTSSLSFAETSANKKAKDNFKDGDIIEVVGVINFGAEGGVSINTNCFRLGALEKEVFLTETKEMENNLKHGIGRRDYCDYRLDLSGVFFNLAKFRGKKVSMLARIRVYDIPVRLESLSVGLLEQFATHKIIYLLPLEIEEIK